MRVETLNELMLLIQTHHHENPGHGMNCACMDKWIAAFKRLSAIEEKPGNMQRRLDYVIHAAISNR